MPASEGSQKVELGGSSPGQQWGTGGTPFWRRHRWLGFVLPFVVYMGVGVFEPIRPPPKPKPPVPDRPVSELGLLPEPSPEMPPLEDHPQSSPDPQASPPSGKEPSSGGLPEKTTSTAESALLPVTAKPVPQTTGPDKKSPPTDSATAVPPETNWAGIPYSAYPAVYTLKLVLTCLAVLGVWPVYREFPFRLSVLGVLVGLGGLIIWLGFGQLNLERKWLEPIGLSAFVDLGARSGFNPFRVFQDHPAWMLWGFIAVRLFGMVVIVALVEEFFLRGFLMRYVVQEDWWQVPVGHLSWAALVACVVYAAVSHPAELFGAIVWFLLVSLLAYKTKNIWDCVLAHATTNALLGAYILLLAEWKYW